ncbi:uncharacterized protein [Nicotiana sylvestris]|uniref:uncharacterized protein n=1 Tax=Nicotiana sylvestris TaxID=4096 RepID=UPI00388CA577
MDHQQEDVMQDLYESPNSKNEGEQLASGVKALQLSNDEKDRLYSTWKYSLIIKLFGKRIMHHYLKVKIQELWKSIKQFPLIDLRSDYFIVKFTKEENMNNVLRNGPWFVNGHFLSVIKWQPNFVAGKAQQTNTIVWIRLPQLPTEYYDGALLKRIGNSIGTLLKIDACTSSTLRGQYARLCTQVPLEEPVTTCIQIDSHLQQIIYEGEVFLCKYYGRMGHTAIRCLHRQRGKRPIPESTQDGQEIAQDSSTLHKQQMVKDNSSEWQTVSFAKRRINTTNQKQRPREAVKEKKLQHSPGIGVSFTTKEQGKFSPTNTFIYQNKPTGYYPYKDKNINQVISHNYTNKDKNNNRLLPNKHSKDSRNISHNTQHAWQLANQYAPLISDVLATLPIRKMKSEAAKNNKHK